MMNRLNKLVQEIHRRSLWQVLGIYLIGGWIALQVVDTMAGALKLPDWSSPVALLLLIIGLPIVLATAFVQEGVGRRRDDRPATQLEITAGGTRIEHVIERQEGAGRSVFTWRNALLGGLVAFALWGVIATGWIFFADRGPGGGSSTDTGVIQSIAVLPFVNMSEDESNAYFAAGMSEQLLDALAKVPGLKVPARTSSFQFEGANIDVREVGEKLDVETVLEGSVRRDGDRVRITAQLVSADDGYHIWSETYDRQMASIFDLQDEITHAIVDALRIRLPGGEETRLVRKPTDDLEAYNFYLQGRLLLSRRSDEGLRGAIEFFEQAIARDSSYALAWAGIADAYQLLAQYGLMSRTGARRPATHAAEKALELDDQLAESHVAMAGVIWTFEPDEDERAAEAFRRAISINPNSAQAHFWYGELLFGDLRRFEEGLAEIRRALELDPLSPAINTFQAVYLWRNAEEEEALEQFHQTIELFPDFSEGHGQYAGLLIELGRYDEAEQALDRASELDPRSRRNRVRVVDLMMARGDYEGVIDDGLENPMRLAVNLSVLRRVGTAYAYLGRFDEAARMARGAAEAHPESWVTLAWAAWIEALVGREQEARALLARVSDGEADFWKAVAYARLGELDRAFELLEAAVEQRAFHVLELPRIPAVDPFRSDPRWDALLQRLGLTDSV